MRRLHFVLGFNVVHCLRVVGLLVARPEFEDVARDCDDRLGSVAFAHRPRRLVARAKLSAAPLGRVFELVSGRCRLVEAGQNSPEVCRLGEGWFRRVRGGD